MDTPRPSPRTKWTRRVPDSVLIGHAASLTLCCRGQVWAEPSNFDIDWTVRQWRFRPPPPSYRSPYRSSYRGSSYSRSLLLQYRSSYSRSLLLQYRSSYSRSLLLQYRSSYGGASEPARAHAPLPGRGALSLPRARERSPQRSAAAVRARRTPARRRGSCCGARGRSEGRGVSD